MSRDLSPESCQKPKQNWGKWAAIFPAYFAVSAVGGHRKRLTRWVTRSKKIFLMKILLLWIMTVVKTKNFRAVVEHHLATRGPVFTDTSPCWFLYVFLVLVRLIFSIVSFNFNCLWCTHYLRHSQIIVG